MYMLLCCGKKNDIKWALTAALWRGNILVRLLSHVKVTTTKRSQLYWAHRYHIISLMLRQWKMLLFIFCGSFLTILFSREHKNTCHYLVISDQTYWSLSFDICYKMWLGCCCLMGKKFCKYLCKNTFLKMGFLFTFYPVPFPFRQEWLS